MKKSLKKHVKITLIFALGVFIAAMSVIFAAYMCSYSADAVSSLGSTGSEVVTIQKKLKNWGYYSGNIDGVYGVKTQSAVKQFQKKNGLSADGIAGKKTLEAMGIFESTNTSDYSASERNLLTRIISAEARGEPYEGQVAVGAVILNRVSHPSFPNSIAGVVYQPGAFSALDDGQFSQPVDSNCIRAATAALNGSDPSGGAIYYYNPEKSTNKWIFSRPVIKQIGNHIFAS